MVICNTPRVSVVIPVYNRAHIISRALDSIACQTYKNYEVVIVDDCSSDSLQLVEAIESYNDRLEIVYHRHTVNRHGGAARNTGVELSTGEYVAFLDSDDAWLPTKLEVMVQTLHITKASFAYSKLEKVGTQIGVFPHRGIYEHESVADYLLVAGGTMQTSTLILRSDIFSSVKFDESLTRFQDYDFVIALDIESIRPVFVNEVLVRMHDDDQAGRISNSHDFNVALSWVNKVKANVSPTAYARFMVDRVVKYCIYSKNKSLAKKLLSDKSIRFYVTKRKIVFSYFLYYTPSFLVPSLRVAVAYAKKTFGRQRYG